MTVTTDIATDLLTPLGAYLRLRGRPGARGAFLLESVERGRLGRYSFVGSGSRLVDVAEAERLVEPVVAPEAVLASNTSSLSITAIAGAVRRPERVLGMHFFNPVHVMKLVEVVVHARTAAPVRDRVIAFARALGKEPILVRDAPGFASSRLGVTLWLEAMRMLESGVASAEDIDKAMKLGTNMPMGPFELADYTGIDIGLDVMEVLFRETGDPKFRPSPLLRKYVRAGRFGRKSGRGVYDYTKG